MIKKTILFLTFFLVFINIVYAGGRTYVETNNVYWSYEVWQTTDVNYNILSLPSNRFSSGGSFISGFYSYPDTPGAYGLLFRYPSLTEDLTFKKAPVDLSATGTGPTTNFFFEKYNVGTYLELNNICQPSLISSYVFFDNINNIYNYNSISSTLNPLQTTSGSQIVNEELVIPHLLDKYYYMKAFVILNISNGQKNIYAFPENVYTNVEGNPILYKYGSSINQAEVVNNVYAFNSFDSRLINRDSRFFDVNGVPLVSILIGAPYILLKPESINLQFNLNEINRSLTEQCAIDSSFCGIYQAKVTIIPIDGKCDFTNDGQLNPITDYKPETSTPSTIFTITQTPPINPTTCSITSSTGSTKTLQIGESINIYSTTKVLPEDDCSNYATLVTCNLEGVLTTYDALTYNHFFCFDPDEDNDGILNRLDQCPYDKGPKLLNGCPKPFTNTTKCDNFDMENQKLTINTEDIVQFKQSESTLVTTLSPLNGLLDLMYRDFGDYEIKDISNNICKIKYHGPEVGILDADLSLNPDLTVSDIDYQRGIFTFDPENQITYFVNVNGIREAITLPTTLDKYIEVYKNNIFEKNEVIKPELIALRAHSLYNFETKQDGLDFVEKSYNLMTRLNITKNIDNQTIGKNKIKYTLQIPQADRINLSIYLVLSKIQAADISQIKILESSNGQFIVREKDPIIGWHFSQSEGDEQIEIEIPGSGDGGTIIVTQEPILFNEGELIVNYRQTICNIDEAHLFDLESLSNSIVLENTGLYKVCVAHLTENLANAIGDNPLNIGSYNTNSNFSLQQSLTNQVVISTQNNDLVWDLKVQKRNPNGNYSCIGSVDNITKPSLFGDCGYRENNRIWLHLGEDITPPTTTLSYPYLAHTIRVKLTAVDQIGGSEIDKTYYCIVNSTNTCSSDSDYTIYTKEVILTCTDTWGCVKEVLFYSTDFKNNKETPKKEVLTLLDEGSACQADCTAKPSPNRYLSGCNNLNGCNYYDYNQLNEFDDGEYVAEQCNLFLENSWTKFNTTHEIKCPNGPFRQSRFTLEKLFYQNSNCDHYIVIPYSVLIEGESVLMKFIYCMDY